MTLLNSQNIGGSTCTNTYVYYLIAPAAGANNVVITASTSCNIWGYAASYTGVDQTAPIIPIGGKTAIVTGTSLTTSITTIINNCWIYGIGQNGNSSVALTAGASTSILGSSSLGTHFDSNGPLTPTGSKNCTLNRSSSGLFGINMVAFAPARPTPGIYLNVTVAGTDRTAYIDWPSFTIDNVLNRQVNTCSFSVKNYPSKNWAPAAGDEITVVDWGTTIFAGVVVQSKQVVDGLLLKYEVQCKDWTQYLDRQLVISKTYTSMTVNAIVADLAANYLTGFTLNHVSCTVSVPSITFDMLTISQCLSNLADQVSYNWYVDYSKDIHFFATNSETAPFGLTDTNDNYNFKSLEIIDDITKLRNQVFITDSKTPKYNTYYPTSSTSNTVFYFDYDFYAYNGWGNNCPYIVTAGSYQCTLYYHGSLVVSGSGYSATWDDVARTLTFSSAVSGSVSVVGSATINKTVQNSTSISTYGVYMYGVSDDGITSIGQAVQIGNSILALYSDKQQAGQFKTYNSGLVAGQIISIQSTIRSLNANYIIQRVSLAMRGPSDGEFTVEFATWRTVDLVNILQNILLKQIN